MPAAGYALALIVSLETDRGAIAINFARWSEYQVGDRSSLNNKIVL
ncbi:hypothetical protein PN499_07825 [Kamptonema animale CS-326]|nr:hypothetical protein [Kamptonema animale]MDB9511088.1 hypothetical protein [Kamptonema animale CS-326]